jgi:hypothetical protein
MEVATRLGLRNQLNLPLMGVDFPYWNLMKKVVVIMHHPLPPKPEDMHY